MKLLHSLKVFSKGVHSSTPLELRLVLQIFTQGFHSSTPIELLHLLTIFNYADDGDDDGDDVVDDDALAVVLAGPG